MSEDWLNFRICDFEEAAGLTPGWAHALPISSLSLIMLCRKQHLQASGCPSWSEESWALLLAASPCRIKASHPGRSCHAVSFDTAPSNTGTDGESLAVHGRFGQRLGCAEALAAAAAAITAAAQAVPESVRIHVAPSTWSSDMMTARTPPKCCCSCVSAV